MVAFAPIRQARSAMSQPPSMEDPAWENNIVLLVGNIEAT